MFSLLGPFFGAKGYRRVPTLGSILGLWGQRHEGLKGSGFGGAGALGMNGSEFWGVGGGVGIFRWFLWIKV